MYCSSRKTEIIQSDKDSEFRAKIIINYLKKEDIIFINSGVRHPQTNGVVEAFNKNIINKYEHILLDNNKEFDIKLGFKKDEEINNNTIYISRKLNHLRHLKFSDKNDINNDIKNVLKGQAKVYRNFNIISKGERCFLNKTFIKRCNVLKNKFNKKCKYLIPIIIEEVLDGTQYSFKAHENIMELNKNVIYRGDYQLIKRCNIEV